MRGPRAALPADSNRISNRHADRNTNAVERRRRSLIRRCPGSARGSNLKSAKKTETSASSKTIDNRFFQRATVFIGAPDAKNYTIEADVHERRQQAQDVRGGHHQPALPIVLKGNEQKLEINSNLERLRELSQDFKWQPKSGII